MAEGRRRESRIHAVVQAALVWANEDINIEDFIEKGNLAKSANRMHPELRARVDEQVERIVKNGGKFVMEK